LDGNAAMVNFGLIFMTLALILGINADQGFIVRLGFDPDLLMIATLAFVITGLVVHRRLALIVTVVLLTVGANAPASAAIEIGYDPDIALAALFALVVLPVLVRWVDR
jgi:hypothetical protein